MIAELTFDTYGEPLNPAVVLIHPFPFRAEFWSSVAPKIASAGYFVVAPNLRGCATSPLGDDEPSMDLLADDVWQLVDRLSLDKPFIMGVSLGGYVTLAMLRRRPTEIAGLGLIDTKATNDSPAAIRNRHRIASEVHAELRMEDYAHQMLPTLLSAHTHEFQPQLVQQVHSWISANDPHTVSWLQHAMASRPDSSDALSQFDGPVLLIRGVDDVVSKPEDFTHMESLAQHPTIVLLKDCAHLPPIEDPIATSDVMTTWLNKQTNQ